MKKQYILPIVFLLVSLAVLCAEYGFYGGRTRELERYSALCSAIRAEETATETEFEVGDSIYRLEGTHEHTLDGLRYIDVITCQSGDEKQTLCKGDITKFFVDDKGIVYVQVSTEPHSLTRAAMTNYSVKTCGLNGENEKTLASLDVYETAWRSQPLKVEGDYVYYLSPENGDLFRVNRNTCENEYISSELYNSWWLYDYDLLCLTDDYIYYIKYNMAEMHRIRKYYTEEPLNIYDVYRMDFEGNSELVAEAVEGFDICGNHIILKKEAGLQTYKYILTELDGAVLNSFIPDKELGFSSAYDDNSVYFTYLKERIPDYEHSQYEIHTEVYKYDLNNYKLKYVGLLIAKE